jgi:membrane associated rhomboid family serine protease
VIVLPIRRGLRTGPVPVATLALAVASTLVFAVWTTRDRTILNTAAFFYVDSGLAAIELPRYREYLQQSTDPDALTRLAHLERAAGPAIDRPVHPLATVEALRSDRDFDRDLHADKVVTPSDPAYPEWQRERRQFDDLEASAMGPQLALSARSWNEPWRLLTHLLVRPSAPAWLTSLLVLLLIGPLAEAAAGVGLFLLCYLGGGAFGAVVNLLFSSRPTDADWAALAALAGLLATTFGSRSMHARLALTEKTIGIPGLAALLIVVGLEAARWLVGAREAIHLPADLAGLAFGAVLTRTVKLHNSHRFEELTEQQPVRTTTTPRHSGLAHQAHEAAKNQDTRRAKDLFKELVDLEPQRLEHLCAYLNVALLGPDETTLQDAALRLLWLRSRSHSDQMRKAFLQLTQPKVLKVLPIDEHLRLARRLVRLREDAAALRVLDAILTDSHLRQLYGRQLADCLLGIYTGYVRRRMTTLAEQIRSRLTTYFEAPDDLGGLEKASHPPTTLLTSGPRSRMPPRS